MNVKALLRRTEGSLSKFLDKQVIEVLQILDPELIRPSNLIDLIEQTVDVNTMIKNSQMRHILIKTMKKDEAEKFAKSIGLKKWNDVNYALLRKKFRKNELKKALEFFEKEFEEESIDNKIDSELISTPKPLFKHQVKTVYNLRKKLSAKPHKALLHMPTGSGKTLCAMRLIAIHLLEKPDALVIWLAHNEELCEQALNEFKYMWSNTGDREINVHRFFGKSKLDPLSINTGFISASLSKMLSFAKKSNTFLSSMADNTDLVVIDEAHQAIAPKFSIIIDVLSENSNTWLLGLSATPGRSSNTTDQENIDLAKFFGNKKEKLDTNNENPIKFLTRNGYLAIPRFNLISHNGSRLSKYDISRIKSEVDIPESVLKKLSDDAKRNLSIVTEIMRLSKSHKKIIVFAASVNHAKVLSLILAAKKYPARYVIGTTPKEVRSQVLEDYRTSKEPMILCNYGILTMGFDVPETSAVVIARPTKSSVLYAQMVGRGIRGPKGGGNKTCEISTVMDDNIEEYFNISKIFSMWEEVWDE